MEYYLFLDESGDHGLVKINPKFPILLLCGVFISKANYTILKRRIDQLKIEFFGTAECILHSRDIRKKEGIFSPLNNPERFKEFAIKFNQIVQQANYQIISTAILKEQFAQRYNSPFAGAYEQAISFIIERCVFCLDEQRYHVPTIKIVAESRSKQEDKVVGDYIDSLRTYGTSYISQSRIESYGFKHAFLAKKFNNAGLQFADMLAYPIARHVINIDEQNRAFDALKPKIHQNRSKKIYGYGLKIFP